MKKLFTIILAAAFASLLFAADVAAPVVTTYLARIQTDPSQPNAQATAFFATTTTIAGQTFDAPWQSVSWKLADTEKSVTVEVDGQPLKLTYAQVSAFVVAIAYQEKEAQTPAPTP
jgi:hypothetical protein